MERFVWRHPIEWARSKKRAAGALGFALGLSLLGIWGCGPSASEESKAIRGRTESGSIRWATGFGFSEDRTTLWIAGDVPGDTVFWTKSNVELESRPGAHMLPQTPLKLATWSTTHVPYVLALGANDQWVGSGYLDRVRQGDDVERVNLGGDAGLSDEALLASDAMLLTSYPFGDPMVGVQNRTGIPVLSFSEYAEPHALGRAEYIKLFGWLLNRESLADSLFVGMELRYQELARMAKLEADKTGWPTVFTGSESGGKWTAPTEAGLVAKMVRDAGGDYAFSDETAEAYGLKRAGSNYEVELEQCALIAEMCDAWGRVVYAREGWTMKEVQAEAPWCDFSSKLVFHCNTAEVDYFGNAVLEPDRMLRDLISVLHPNVATPSEAPYFRRTLSSP